jgi:DNA-binding transcriptional ArsR family regulator
VIHAPRKCNQRQHPKTKDAFTHALPTVMFLSRSKDMESEFDQLIFRARVLSSLSRIDVFACVGEHGAYPSDISSTLSLSPATVSHHLRVLEHAGLVRHVKQGRNRLYLITGVSWGVVSWAEVEAMLHATPAP